MVLSNGSCKDILQLHAHGNALQYVIDGTGEMGTVSIAESSGNDVGAENALKAMRDQGVRMSSEADLFQGLMMLEANTNGQFTALSIERQKLMAYTVSDRYGNDVYGTNRLEKARSIMQTLEKNYNREAGECAAIMRLNPKENAYILFE